MQKKLTFLLLLCQGCFFSAFSQFRTTDSTLQKMAREIGSAQEKDYALTLQLARQKGWPLVVNGKNGKLIRLTSVDAFGNPVYTSTFNNTIAAATTRTNQLWPGGSSGLNLSGSSNAVKGKLGIWDGGAPLVTHVELAGRIVSKDGASTSDHSTHTAGTMIAAGVNPVAKGMAFGAQQLISYDFSSDATEMAKEAPNLLLSNHSYGNLAGWNYDGTNWSWYGDTSISRESYYFGYYSREAQLYDSIAYNAPNYLICFGSGNSRSDVGPDVGKTYQYNGNTTVTRVNLNNNPDYGSVALNATAKNVLLVGAVNGLPSGYSTPTDVSLAGFSAAGPTDDGRIKPDLVADGVNITSSSGASNTAYESLSGTSMACPNTTGSLYLLQEYYTRLHPGSFMRAATLKALALHTADEAGTTGPDYRYGWGLLNVLKAANAITSSYNHRSDTLIESSLNNAANATYSVNVTASGNGKLYATIVWNDPPGVVITARNSVLNNPAPKLVHDLDLRIVKQSDGTTYLPWILTPSSPSAAAKRGDNTLDNVEQVVVDGAIPGQTYTIQVTHKGSLARSTQAFSLVVSGIGGKAYCTTSAATSTAGTRIDNVNFAGITNTTPAGCTKYNNFTNFTAQIEPNKTSPITIKLSSCDASINSRVVKVYIDYNSDGVFNEASELAASGTVAGGTQTFTANVTTPSLIIGNAGLMRIVVQETANASGVTSCNAYNNGETQDYSAVFISPSNDVSLPSVNLPLGNACASSSQFVQLAIRNLGKVPMSNVQVTAVVKNGATTVATLTGTYPVSILPATTVPYTLQTPFSSLPATTYTITAYLTGNTADQNLFNDTVSTTITTAPKPATPFGLAEICGSTALLRATNPTSANYVWYAATPLTAPIATGSSASSTTISSSYYLQTGLKGNIGLTTKNGLGSGGYQIGGNYLNYTSKIPLVLESARLFTRRAGQVTLYVADFDANGNGTILTGTTFEVYPTNPNYQTVAAGVNDPADTGAIFPIGLNLPTGSHSIYAIATDTLLFRNNGLVTNRYPFSIPNVISITGNSAIGSGTPFSNFYYYLYNMTVSTADCVSDAAAIVPTTAPTPVITQSGNDLTSSIATGNQWYLNNSPIAGATGSTYTPTQSGTYSVTVTDALGCKRVSNNFEFSITALPTVPSSEINLRLLPNPTTGNFAVKLHLITPANLQFDLHNPHGQRVYTKTFKNATGDFSTTVKAEGLASGVYVLRITDGKKAYYEKVMIVR